VDAHRRCSTPSRSWSIVPPMCEPSWCATRTPTPPWSTAFSMKACRDWRD